MKRSKTDVWVLLFVFVFCLVFSAGCLNRDNKETTQGEKKGSESSAATTTKAASVTQEDTDTKSSESSHIEREPVRGVDDSGPYNAGEQGIYHVSGVIFKMRLAPGMSFPTGLDDNGTAVVKNDFWIAETPVTYELWHVVFNWAMQNGYFLSAAREGNGEYALEPSARKNEPATSINWYCAVIWCNALTEYYNDQNGTDLMPVYLFDGEVAKTIASEKTDFTLNEAADGFRLPTMDEFELAARFKGKDDSHNTIEHPADLRGVYRIINPIGGAASCPERPIHDTRDGRMNAFICLRSIYREHQIGEGG